MPKQDVILMEVLPDGTCKMTTDKISAANHGIAANLIAGICRRLGGLVTYTKRGLHGHQHQHTDHHHEH